MSANLPNASGIVSRFALRPSTAIAIAVLAVLSAAVGVGVERWLFFAEAEHVSMLYYGRAAA